jgi:hypothetical protein
MSYMQDVEKWLAGLLPPLLQEDQEAFAGFVKAVQAKLLESYRNGQRACPKCNPRPPRPARRP